MTTTRLQRGLAELAQRAINGNDDLAAVLEYLRSVEAEAERWRNLGVDYAAVRATFGAQGAGPIGRREERDALTDCEGLAYAAELDATGVYPQDWSECIGHGGE